MDKIDRFIKKIDKIWIKYKLHRIAWIIIFILLLSTAYRIGYANGFKDAADFCMIQLNRISEAIIN